LLTLLHLAFCYYAAAKQADLDWGVWIGVTYGEWWHDPCVMGIWGIHRKCL